MNLEEVGQGKRIDYQVEAQKIETLHRQRLDKLKAAVEKIFGEGEAGEINYHHMKNDRGYVPTLETERLAPLAAELGKKEDEIESQKREALRAIESLKPPIGKTPEEKMIDEI